MTSGGVDVEEDKLTDGRGEKKWETNIWLWSGLKLGFFLSVHAGHAPQNYSEPDRKRACPVEVLILPYF